MAKKPVFCITKTEAQAEVIVGDLREAGFSHTDVSVLFPATIGSRRMGRSL